MLLERSVKDFLDVLSSGEPAPGGGSVAAMAGALSASMVSMVCNIILKKKSMQDYYPEAEEILHRSEEIRHRFEDLLEQDSEAFGDVMGAMKLPKTTDEEKTVRKEAIQHTLKKASYVPLRTMEYSADCLKLAHRISEIGTKSAISDIGVAAIMANSALHSAWLNVAINLESLEDRDFVARIHDRAEELMDEVEGLADEVLEIVEEVIYSD
jgi:formiminotetrahydrofolate cyclodeaminase